MDYTITSYDDASRTMSVAYKGYNIEVKYPEDADTYADIPEQSIALLVSGIIAPYIDMPPYVEPLVTTTSTEWF